MRLSLIILSLVIVGCSSREQSHNVLLKQADAIIYKQPDSVMSMIERSHAAGRYTTADTMLSRLLTVETLHQSGVSILNDSSLIQCQQYYEQAGDEHHLARTLLHRGIIYYKQQQLHLAFYSLKQAELLAADMHDQALNRYLFSVMGDVNDNLGNYAVTLRYYKQALAAAQQCSDDQWTVRVLNNIAQAFDVLQKPDSLRFYTEMAKSMTSHIQGDVKALYMVNRASWMFYSGLLRQAKDTLLLAQQMYPTEAGYHLSAKIALSEGDTLSATSYWYMLTQSLSPDVCIDAYRQLISYYAGRHDNEAVARNSISLNAVYQSLRGDASDIIDMQRQWDEQQKERRQYQYTILLLTIILLMILLTIVVVWLNHRRVDRLNSRFVESQQKYDKTRAELTQMRKQKEREMQQNSLQLKTVVAHLHALAQKGQAADDDSVNQLGQLAFALSPDLQLLLAPLNHKEQAICLFTRYSFQPSEIATLLIVTPQSVTNARVRLLKKLFEKEGGAKDFDALLRNIP